MPKYCVGISADLILQAILKEKITHIVTVPDTHQKTLLTAISEHPTLKLVEVCTEDEVVAVMTGLFIGGCKPIALIQNAGLYACLNSLRGLSLDASIPTCMLIGEYFRDPDSSSRDNAIRVVNLMEPTLDVWGIRHWRLDFPDDVAQISSAISHAWDNSVPTAILIGSPTQ